MGVFIIHLVSSFLWGSTEERCYRFWSLFLYIVICCFDFFFLTGGQRPVSGSGQEGCAFWAQALHIWRHLLLKVRSLNKLLYHKQQRRDGRFKLLTKTLCKRKKSFCWKNVGGQLIFSYHWIVMILLKLYITLFSTISCTVGIERRESNIMFYA